jgi:multidrug resistance efflux pump
VEALLAQTRAELEKVKAELAAREASIRAPLSPATQRVAAIEAELATTRRKLNEVKLQANAHRPRGPFITRTASIVRVGLAVMLASFAAQLLLDELLAAALPIICLVVGQRRTERE